MRQLFNQLDRVDAADLWILVFAPHSDLLYQWACVVVDNGRRLSGRVTECWCSVYQGSVWLGRWSSYRTCLAIAMISTSVWHRTACLRPSVDRYASLLNVRLNIDTVSFNFILAPNVYYSIITSLSLLFQSTACSADSEASIKGTFIHDR